MCFSTVLTYHHGCAVVARSLTATEVRTDLLLHGWPARYTAVGKQPIGHWLHTIVRVMSRHAYCTQDSTEKKSAIKSKADHLSLFIIVTRTVTLTAFIHASVD